MIQGEPAQSGKTGAAQESWAELTAQTIKIRHLKDAGFKEAGKWKLNSRPRLPQFEGQMPEEPGVYAFVVKRKVRYIGSAQRGLHRRFRSYTNPKNKGTVATRIRKHVSDALAKGDDVKVLAIICTPLSWNGLPVNLVAGLEEGLIRSLKPKWNRRGLPKNSN